MHDRVIIDSIRDKLRIDLVKRVKLFREHSRKDLRNWFLQKINLRCALTEIKKNFYIHFQFEYFYTEDSNKYLINKYNKYEGENFRYV